MSDKHPNLAGTRVLPYLLLAETRAAAVLVPLGYDAGPWGELKDAFAAAAGRGRAGRIGYVGATRLDRHDRVGRVWYTWGLAGPHGAYFDLYARPGVTPAEVSEARRHIRRQHDVASMAVRRIRAWVEFDAAALGCRLVSMDDLEDPDIAKTLHIA